MLWNDSGRVNTIFDKKEESDMDKISIIIPVYNVEPYIRKCLDSVINQTHRNLEILLINDGSTDNSEDICEEYAGKDGRIKVFHKENGGVSSARNVGLRNFTGEYVGFIDPDDWAEPEMFEVLYNLIKEKNVSVSVAGFSTATDTETIPRKNIEPIPENVVLRQRDLLTYIFTVERRNAFHVHVYNKLFAAGLFLNGDVVFDDEIFYAEDIPFIARVFLTPGCTGAYIDKPLYYYYKRATSLVHSCPVEIKVQSVSLALQKSVKLYEENGYGDLTILIKEDYRRHLNMFEKVGV
jgi:glycosyltransferase involved in cell wall biosynthesis